SFLAWAQAPSASTPAIEARADAMLKQLSLEEKIDLISGVNDFYIREIKHVGLPALKMADGPFGVRNYGPSTTFGGLGLAATWDPDLIQRTRRASRAIINSSRVWMTSTFADESGTATSASGRQAAFRS